MSIYCALWMDGWMICGANKDASPEPSSLCHSVHKPLPAGCKLQVATRTVLLLQENEIKYSFVVKHSTTKQAQHKLKCVMSAVAQLNDWQSTPHMFHFEYDLCLLASIVEFLFFQELRCFFLRQTDKKWTPQMGRARKTDRGRREKREKTPQSVMYATSVG